MGTKPDANRRHKDRLFRFLFGESKENALSLYNAVNGSDYNNADDLVFTTIDDVLFLGMKNDLSFLFQSEMNLYEHQSSGNPNMPLRGFLYLAKLMESYVWTHNLNIYGSRLVRLPAPRYIVFYNGTEDVPDVEELQLSDAFEKPGGCVELTATVYNINAGHNRKLMAYCQPLYEYAELIRLIRENRDSGMEIGAAVAQAVDSCIQNGVLADILVKQKAEVVGMLLTEYDEAKVRQMFREEGREEGRVEGREEGKEEGRREAIVNTLQNLIKNLGLTAEQAIAAVGIPAEEKDRYAKLISLPQ